MSVADGLIGALGPVVGYVLKTWWDDRRAKAKQKELVEAAAAAVAAPDGTSDPRTAVIEALIREQFARIESGTRKVQETLNPPMGAPSSMPKLDIDIEQVAEIPKVPSVPDVNAFDDDPTPKLTPKPLKDIDP